MDTSVKDTDLLYWNRYKSSRSPKDRDALLKRVDPLLQKTVNKWAGPIPREVLLNKAKVLAIKSFDS